MVEVAVEDHQLSLGVIGRDIIGRILDRQQDDQIENREIEGQHWRVPHVIPDVVLSRIQLVILRLEPMP